MALGESRPGENTAERSERAEGRTGQSMGPVRTDAARKEKRHLKFEQHLEKNTRKNRAFADWMELVTEVLEIAVAIIVLVGFVMSVIPLVQDMPGLLDNSNNYSFHVFLEHAFNLVIGIEFIRMLIKHTPGSTLGVLLFAIARHMVLDGSSGLELLMGVGSIAGIFAIRKYLYVHSFESSKDESMFTWFREQDQTKDKV